MPGGRPRKYPNKAAAKAADRLRAVERKAAATKALREGHVVLNLSVLQAPDRDWVYSQRSPPVI